MPRLCPGWQNGAMRLLHALGVGGGAAVPTWEEAYERLVTEGRLSRVAHPSPDHEARRFPKPRLIPLIGQDMKGKV